MERDSIAATADKMRAGTFMRTDWRIKYTFLFYQSEYLKEKLIVKILYMFLCLKSKHLLLYEITKYTREIKLVVMRNVNYART